MHEPFSVHAWGGYGYCINFSDDYSKFGYVYRKSNALDKFIEFKAELDNILGINIKTVWLDQSEMSCKFDSFHWSMGLLPSYVHQHLHCIMER